MEFRQLIVVLSYLNDLDGISGSIPPLHQEAIAFVDKLYLEWEISAAKRLIIIQSSIKEFL